MEDVVCAFVSRAEEQGFFRPAKGLSPTFPNRKSVPFRNGVSNSQTPGRRLRVALVAEVGETLRSRLAEINQDVDVALLVGFPVACVGCGAAGVYLGFFAGTLSATRPATYTMRE